jgi:hypothetical protein
MPNPNDWQPTEIDPGGAGVDPSPDGLGKFILSIDLASLLTDAKALVFRDFGVGVDRLPEVMDLLLPNRLAYVHGNSPRSKVGNNLYTSTEYPASQPISMHNELSYLHKWPSRLLFFAEKAAETGGATPVVDGAAWLEAIDPEVRAAFSAGVRYAQNLHSGAGLGKSWQQTFETDDREQVEEYLADAGATWSWLPDGGLRVSQTRPATVRHPQTGVEVWFNQADQWHVAGLGDSTAAALARILPEEQLPMSASFGDGSPDPGRLRDARP